MERLSDNTLEILKPSAAKPGYDRNAVGIGIVHMGPGAFHRGHQAIYTEDAVKKSGGDWGICAVSLNSDTVAKALTPQNGLYTLAIKDKTPAYRVVGIIKEALCARHEPEKVMARLTSAAVKFVTLTITEKGYALNALGRLDVNNARIAADLKTPSAPISAIGYLVEASRLRRELRLKPLTLVSCDNLPDNGDKLKTACEDFAELIDKDLAIYIAGQVRFPNTMVDSITPATDKGVLADVSEHIGLEDASPIQREAFKQWVIEDNLPEDRPDWAGAGAIVTNDVAGFEKTKLRILNGAHSTLTYLGLLAGEESVEDAINNAALRSFVDELITEESIPTIEAPDGLELNAYWSDIQARFENPHIRHLLEQISHDGSQKIPARIFPVILHHMKEGRIAKRACFVAGAWIAFNHARRKLGDNPVDGYLDQISDMLPVTHSSPELYAAAFLENQDICPGEIAAHPGVRGAIIKAAKDIAELGVLAALSPITLELNPSGN